MQITASKDFQPVLTELRKQSWALERKKSGWQAKAPASKGGGLVHFSESEDHHALKNTISALKAKGFEWPPLDSREQRGQLRRRTEVEITDSSGTRVESMMVRASPPPPVPEYIDATLDEEQAEDDDSVEADRIFAELKSARDAARFARELRDDCRRLRDEAQRDLDKAEEDTLKMDAALREKKAEFDRFFGDGGP